MSSNLIIGILAAIVIIGGGAWLIESGAFDSNGTATSTPAVATGTDTSGTSVADNTPGAPVAITGTLVVASNSSAVLNSKVVSNGAQTTYWYEYGRTQSLGSRTDSQAIGSGYVNISAPAFVTGLSANTNYYFRLVAQNNYGTSNGSIIGFSTNDNPAPTGSAPTSHTDAATAVTRTSANLAGHLTPNGAETSFWFEYGTTNNLGNTTSFQSAGSGNGSVNESVPVSGLQPATKYYFRMNAQNQFGTINGSILTFTTSGPVSMSAPSADTTAASNVARTSVTLNGRVNPNGDSTSYWFEYSDDSILGHIIGTTTHKVVAGSGTSFVNVSTDITGLKANTTYSYRIVTMNTSGTTQGDIVTVKTKN